MVKLILLLVGLGAIILVVKTSNFGTFLGGALTGFSAFGSAISGVLTPQIAFAIGCVILVLLVAVATIFI